jgi:excisionase family DNA binding protein
MQTNRLAYSIYEACGLLSVGRTTLYSAIKKGELKTCKVGRRTLISAEALKLWLETLPTSLDVNSKALNDNRGGSHE